MSEDNENIKAAKDDAIRTKGYFILPSQLFSNVAAMVLCSMKTYLSPVR